MCPESAKSWQLSVLQASSINASSRWKKKILKWENLVNIVHVVFGRRAGEGSREGRGGEAGGGEGGVHDLEPLNKWISLSLVLNVRSSCVVHAQLESAR